MTLRNKTLVILGLTLVGVIVVLYALAQHIVLSAAADLDAQRARESVERVVEALTTELQQLDGTTSDWSAWTDTYLFVQDENAEYVEDNLADSTFTSLRINLMVFVDPAGQVVFGKAMELDAQAETALPAALAGPLDPNGPLVAHAGEASSRVGILMLPEGPLLFASRPILTNEHEGPIAGALIVGRYLSAGHLPGLPVEFLVVNQASEAPPIASLEEVLSSPGAIRVDTIDERVMAGFAELPDVQSGSRLLLKVESQRSAFLQAQTSLRYFLVSILAVGLSFGAVSMLLLERLVLARLANLSQSVQQIGASGQLSERVELAGDDELASLGQSINWMLERLAATQGELRHSQEHYRTFIEQSSEGIWRFEMEEPAACHLPEDEQIALFYRTAYLAECNDVMARMYGYAHASELAGIRLGAMLPASEPASWDMLRAFVQSGYRLVGVETQEPDRDGQIKYFVNNMIGIVENGALVRVWGTQQDVTERKRVEAAEREQRVLAEALRDTAAALNTTLDMDEVLSRILTNVGRVVPHDAANIMLVEAGTGLVYDSYYGKSYGDHGTSALRTSAQGWRLGRRFPVEDVVGLRQMAETGRPLIIPDTYEDPEWVVFPETPWIRSYVGAPIRSKGEILGFLNLDSATPGFFTSLHAERLLAFADQAAVAIENARLFRQIAQVNEDLQQAVQRANELAVAAEAANAAKSDFLANTSHELRTPLTGILGALSIILDGLYDSAHEQHELLKIAHTASQNLLAIVNDVLDIAKIEARKMEAFPRAMDLQPVLNEVYSLLRPQAEERQLRLEIVTRGPAPAVFADPEKVRQILLNLVGNALKFTEAGQVLVEVTGDRSAGEVAIRVRDTGIGIPLDAQGKLFQPFVQVDGSRTRQYGGTGLGLSIARRLAEMMNGTLTLYSAGRGQGSTFTLRLPLAATAELAESPAA